MAGKGDTPRPVDFKKYQENYDFIFGSKEESFFALGDIVQKGVNESVGEYRNRVGNKILDESSNI
jgi:hypothetical protein